VARREEKRGLARGGCFGFFVVVGGVGWLCGWEAGVVEQQDVKQWGRERRLGGREGAGGGVGGGIGWGVVAKSNVGGWAGEGF